MVSSIAFALGLLAFTPFAAASPVVERQAEPAYCFDEEESSGSATVEYLDACINMLRNDFGDQTCSFAIGGDGDPVFCDIGDAVIQGLMPEGDVDGNEIDPTCNEVASAAESVKQSCDFGQGIAGIGRIETTWGKRDFVVDHVESRLKLAASQGAIPINFVESDPVVEIMKHEPNGVMRWVEAVGMESLNGNLEIDEDILIQQMIHVTHIGGGIGIVGVYLATEDNPAAPLASTISPNATVAMNNFFGKGLSMRGGSVDPKLVAPELIRLIQKGEARPSFITSALIGIDEAQEYYRRFEQHEEIKIFIKFQ